MTNKSAAPVQAVRQRAEEQYRLNEATDSQTPSPEETEHLLHELRVHQIELEMQNEELRRSQEDLDASKSKYFDLYELAPVCYLTISEQGLIMEANLAAATMFGVEQKYLLKKSMSEIIFPEDQDDYYFLNRRLIETGEMQDCQIRLKRADGKPLWVRLQAAPAQGGECRLIINDINMGKQAEAALAVNEHFKQAIIDSLPANIAVIDQNGLITATNKPWLNFGHGNDITDERCIAVGADYLASCRKAAALDDSDSETANSALLGITSVLEGRETSFVMHYPCHSPDEKRWFQMSVVRPETGFEGAVISHIDISTLKLLEENRRSYISHLVDVVEQERLRTARELHDDLGQRLTVLSFGISHLKQTHQERMDASQILPDLQSGIDGMMESLRRICAKLRPALLDELGLSAALQWLSRDFTHRSGIPCSFTFDGECCDSNVECCDSNVECCYSNVECAMTVFRIIQESLNNIIKHAAASKAGVSLCRVNGSMVVEINDDGCGFMTGKDPASRSFGIIGMRERAHALGATFEITSKNKGTNVTLIIPCKWQEGRDALSHS